MDNKKVKIIPPEKRTEKYWALLNTVIDPEIGIGIVDLGLVYNVEIKDQEATVTMTLTSTACPVGPTIIHGVEEEAEQIEGVKKVSINLVWDPAWTADRINPDVRAMMGI
ncbi:MAG TPA: metal-sulfur cluster assembly factor [Candidatus Udaeobacter sp.]|nr:metal-sulfur cluster assembly factor [Candidatus Udaeobacter sp.]